MYGVELEALFAPTSADRFTANVQYLHGKYDNLLFDAFSNNGAAIRQGCTVTGSRLANPGVNNARFYSTDCSGQQTINSPKWTLNLGYQHRFDLGDMDLTVGADTQIQSSRYLSINYLPEMRQGSFMMSNAFITLENPKQRWSITGYINNIEDAEVLSNAGLKPIVDVVYVALRPPRTYGVRLGYKF
jgi:iron complex outermembrane receptor protein